MSDDPPCSACGLRHVVTVSLSRSGHCIFKQLCFLQFDVYGSVMYVNRHSISLGVRVRICVGEAMR